MIDSFLNYIQHEKRYSKNTLISYQSDLLQFNFFLDQTYQVPTPEKADYNLIRAWIVSLSDSGINPKSINRKIATLKSYYKFLIKKEYIQTNPVVRIKPLKVAKQTPDFIEEDKLMQLLDGVDFGKDFFGLRNKLILEFLYATGTRLDELLQLQMHHIDFYNLTVKVVGKRKRERIIPIQSNLANLIKEYQERKLVYFDLVENEYLILTDDGKQSYPAFIYLIVKKYLSLITSQDKKSPHTLRHSFATHLLNKGADLNAIKDLLGHSSLSATQVYTHNSLDKLKAIFNQAHPKA